ncbi:MAG: DUF1194 domain-containing protein [Neomegalonema sp.]|nr:DUF1194 domain-containing protein [Neomegalonema sp.]
MGSIWSPRSFAHFGPVARINSVARIWPFARLASLAAFALAQLAFGGSARSEEPCRAALVLALDISSSVDMEEQTLQTGGLARALRSDEVRRAILDGPGSVAIAAFSWSNAQTQYHIADWHLLRSDADIDRLATRIAGARSFRYGRATALGKALSYAAWLHRINPHDCITRIVDVSGDGVNNDAASPSYFRKVGRLDGLIINGLVIRNDQPDPYRYYLDQVIQGPGAFVIDIDSYDDYETAMKRKLLRELSPLVAMPQLPRTLVPEG